MVAAEPDGHAGEPAAPHDARVRVKVGGGPYVEVPAPSELLDLRMASLLESLASLPEFCGKLAAVAEQPLSVAVAAVHSSRVVVSADGTAHPPLGAAMASMKHPDFASLRTLVAPGKELFVHVSWPGT